MKTFKEFVDQLTESVDHRELGAKGQIHRSVSQSYKVGEHSDFYSKGSGDKLYGKVIKNEGSKIVFDVKEKHHSYKVV